MKDRSAQNDVEKKHGYALKPRVLPYQERKSDNYPSLRDKLLNPEGAPRAHFLIYLNGRVVHREDLEATPVRQDSEIKIFTVLAGG